MRQVSTKGGNKLQDLLLMLTIVNLVLEIILKIERMKKDDLPK